MNSDSALTALGALGLLAIAFNTLVGVRRRHRFAAYAERRSGFAAKGRRQFRLSATPGKVTSAEDLAQLSLEVASRLRAGAPVEAAWAKAWEQWDPGGFLGVSDDGAPINLTQLAKRAGRRPSSQAVQMRQTAAAVLAAACRFSFNLGAPLATVLEVMATSIGQAGAAIAAQRQAFVGPRFSAVILSLLPVVVMIAGELLGANTLGWLLGNSLGHLCLLLGLSFLVAGQGLSYRLIRRARQRVAEEVESTLLGDLAGSGLVGGSSIPQVLVSLSEAHHIPELRRIAAELVMDANWDEAWNDFPREASVLHHALRPAWEEGVSPLLVLSHIAATTREAMVTQAQQSAAKLAVQLVLPLGTLLLPAFIFLGVIPLIFTLLGGQLQL